MDKEEFSRDHTEGSFTCWVALGDPKTSQSPTDTAWEVLRGDVQTAAGACHGERTNSLSCQQAARENQALLPLPEAVHQLGSAPAHDRGSC